VSERGFIDLHCHWVAAIDDGARSAAESAELLRGLKSIGFDRVVATPHMRPGMFDNTRADLERAYEATVAALAGASDLPELGLSSEHWFDDIVFARLLSGEALPYPGGHAALVEFPTTTFPARVAHRFFDLRARRLRPVLAHPERYEPVWRDVAVLDPVVDGGTVLLLDVAALAGKYGRAPRRAAEELLEEGYYYAACSDAHAPRDVAEVEKGIKALYDLAGAEEASFLLRDGPRAILEGTVDV
jgi:protein-tyrosine phosphatase